MKRSSIFTLAIWPLAGSCIDQFHGPLSMARTCCRNLSRSPGLHRKVFRPGSDGYEARIDGYWSVSAALEPWCVVVPDSSQDVSTIIKILVAGSCPFGITGGGHATFPGANSIDDGVSIDFANMNATSYDAGTGLVSVRPGGHWGDVYDYLSPFGVTVTGGRASIVGVGGFITGGGNSYHSASHGFACDNVKNFEVVLANGTIVNANAEEHADLWLALKGSSGNLGLVTRFDMYSIPFPDPTNPVIWGGSYILDWDSTPQTISAFIDFTDSVYKDENSSSMAYWAWEPLAGGWFHGLLVNNALGIPDPPAMDRYRAIGVVADSTIVGPMSNVTGSNNAATHKRNVWLTSSWANDERIVAYCVERLQALVADLKRRLSEEEYWNAWVVLQPLTKSMVNAGIKSGGNVMGLKDYMENGNGIMLLFNLWTEQPHYETMALPILKEYIKDVDMFADSLGLGWGWQFLNYADGSQDPLQTVGERARENILQASREYDPNGVFQTLRASGHKI